MWEIEKKPLTSLTPLTRWKPLGADTSVPISSSMDVSLRWSGPPRTSKRMVESVQKVAAPPHRGLAREQVTLLVDGREQRLEVVRQNRIHGQQAYWLCPRCSTLRSHLYVLDCTLACRCCHKLDYRSRHTLHPAVLRVAKLRRRLGAAPGLLSPLPPRHPRWSRAYYARLVGELAVLEAALAARLHDTVLAVERRRPKP